MCEKKVEKFTTTYKLKCVCGVEVKWVGFNYQVRKRPVYAGGELLRIIPEAIVGHIRFICPNCGAEGYVDFEIFPHEVSIVKYTEQSDEKEKFVTSYKMPCSCGATMEWVGFDVRGHRWPKKIEEESQYVESNAIVGYAKFRCPRLDCNRKGLIGIEIHPYELSVVLQKE